MKQYDYEGHEYLVSVYMTTYYHEKYVEQAIESILSQKVDFRYEIVISDDASKDGTAGILKRYEEQYDFIHLNINTQNIGLTHNVFLAKTMCKGKYIVTLSGDDYWIDNDKLQKQVDFLENNDDYIGVATRVEVRTDSATKSDFTVPSIRKSNRGFSLKNYLKGHNVPLNGMMMRNVINENYDLFSIMPKVSDFVDDTTDCLLILILGDIYIMSDSTVAYRRRLQTKGEHNFNSIHSVMKQVRNGIDLLNALHKELNGKYDLFHRYKRFISIGIIKVLRPKHFGEFYSVYKTVPSCYRRRFLFIRSVFHIFSKVLDHITRK